MIKTVLLITVATAAGSLIASKVTPEITKHSESAAKQAGAINIGVTAGGAALVYVLLSGAVG